MRRREAGLCVKNGGGYHVPATSNMVSVDDDTTSIMRRAIRSAGNSRTTSTDVGRVGNWTVSTAAGRCVNAGLG